MLLLGRCKLERSVFTANTIKIWNSFYHRCRRGIHMTKKLSCLFMNDILSSSSWSLLHIQWIIEPASYCASRLVIFEGNAYWDKQNEEDLKLTTGSVKQQSILRLTFINNNSICFHCSLSLLLCQLSIRSEDLLKCGFSLAQIFSLQCSTNREHCKLHWWLWQCTVPVSNLQVAVQYTNPRY